MHGAELPTPAASLAPTAVYTMAPDGVGTGSGPGPASDFFEHATAAPSQTSDATTAHSLKVSDVTVSTLQALSQVCHDLVTRLCGRAERVAADSVRPVDCTARPTTGPARDAGLCRPGHSAWVFSTDSSRSLAGSMPTPSPGSPAP